MDQATINTIVGIGGIYGIARGAVEIIQFIQRRTVSTSASTSRLSISPRKSNGDLVEAFQGAKRQSDIHELLVNMAQNLSHLEYAQIKLRDDLERELGEIRRAALTTRRADTAS